MDIKLKNYKRRQIMHIVMVVFLALLGAGVVVNLYYLSIFDMDEDTLLRSQYKDTSSFAWSYVIGPMHDIYNHVQLEAENQEDIYYEDVDQTETPQLENSQQDKVDALELEKGLIYYYSDDNMTIGNAGTSDRAFFEKYSRAFYAYSDGTWFLGSETYGEYSYAFPEISRNATFYYAVTDDLLASLQEEWTAMRSLIIPRALSIALSIGLGLIIMVYLMATTGRVNGIKEVHLNWVDRIYSDVFIVILISGFAFWFSIAEWIFDGFYYTNSIRVLGQLTTNNIYMMIGLGFLTFIFAVMTMVGVLSILRRIKARQLIRHSLTFIICHRIWEFFKHAIIGKPYNNYPLTKVLFIRQRNFIIASAVLVFLTFMFLPAAPLFLLPPILEMVIIYWYIKANNATFEAINQGFNESLEDQMRAERMKIALVTNVSHDLKTPLTSIISYIDLLSREENLSESARDYISILSKKSNRLKTIVSDLFDLAKSTSGNLALETERLDLKKLVEQTLADMEDEISKSDLKFKVSLTETPIMVYSDGKKLYRVMQNLIDNTLKYAMPETRVFITLKKSGSKAVIEIKNTAAYEMEFTEEEILQRFTRGDDSRSTDGSGLGLSIAESFTQACGGDFILNIDGDLFKVILSFRLEEVQ